MYYFLCNVVKKNRMSYYYKTNNFDLIRLFCLLVESDGNTSYVADKIQKNRTTVVNNIECLEDELKISLFKRIQGRPWILTKKGKEYYEKEAKDMVIAADKLFRHETAPKIEPKCEDDLIKETNQYVANAVTDKLQVVADEITQKIQSKINIKKLIIGIVFLIIVFIGVGFSVYLYKTNYFFDRYLYENASPRLKTLMRDGHYVISDKVICSFEVTQVNLDMYDLVDKLSDTYKNIPIISMLVANNPMISMRFTGDEKIDKVFKDQNFLMCNTNKNYEAGITLFSNLKLMINKNKNFKSYNLYRKDLKDCLHCNYFEENIKKYRNNLFGVKTDKIANIPDLRAWIIKKGDYYYFLAMTNIIANEGDEQKNNPDAKHERHLFWKKITQDELMIYKNGTYWKLIEQNNIKFT